ncbi:MAG: hypothetical protein EU552_00360 [Promethearchaeota archaeon]|nr:MAG: hypothetical protein EU552_00360 [Candidatus Lokiarchaeota archaeon]
MDVKIEYDLSYYDFLKLINVIVINNKSIQKQNICLTFENYDINRVKINLDKKIEKLNKNLKN